MSCETRFHLILGAASLYKKSIYQIEETYFEAESLLKFITNCVPLYFEKHQFWKVVIIMFKLISQLNTCVPVTIGSDK